jgi:hypothetical protein
MAVMGRMTGTVLSRGDAHGRMNEVFPTKNNDSPELYRWQPGQHDHAGISGRKVGRFRTILGFDR